MIELSDIQRKVVNEFVSLIKNTDHIITVDMLESIMWYDYKHGKGEAIQLLDKYIFQLFDEETFSEKEINRIAQFTGRVR